MADGKVKIDVELDDSKVGKGIDEVEKKVKKIGDTGKESADGVREISLAFEQLKKATTAIDSLTSTLKSTNEQANGLKTSLDGSAQAVDGLTAELKEVPSAGQGIDNISNDIKSVDDSSQKAGKSIKEIAVGLGLVKLASSAINVLKNALDGAITRFDTMNQFPRVMEAVGFGADESSKAIERLTAGIQGLPTRLDEVVSTAQRLGMMTKDLRLATDLTLSLNNAFLASGAGAEGASRGLEQYLQMLSTGKVDMQSWKTLQETMGVALNQIAESFGMSVTELYSALQNGSITFDEFNRRIIELNEGVGGFAEVALTGSEGIKTSFTNIGTAVVNGVEKAIRAVDDLLMSITGKNIAQTFDGLKVVINTAFGAIVSGINAMGPVVSGSISVFNALMNVIKALDVVIISLVASFATFKILTQVAAWFSTINTIVKTLQTTKLAYLSVSQLLTAHEIKATAVQKLLALTYGLLTSATVRASVATKAFSAITSFLSGPIGWAVLAVAALAAGLMALWKGFGQATPAMKEMSDSVQKATDDTKALTERTESSADAFDKSISSIDSQRESMTKLMEETVELSKKQNLTAGEQKILKGNIDSLNESVEGLNLSYGKESEALTVSQTAMQARIDLMAEEQKLVASRERMIEVEQEVADVTLQQEVNTRLLAAAQQELDESGFNWFGRNKDLKESVEALTLESDGLIDAQQRLAIEAEVAAEAQAIAAERAAAAHELAMSQGITSIDQLTESQRELVESTQAAYQEYADIATNVFDKVAEESKATIEEMLETSRFNNEAMIQMGTDAAGLRDRFAALGLDASIIDQFIAMGAEGPALVSELTTATDAQLKELVANTDATSTDLKDAFMKMFDIDEAEFVEGFSGLVTSMEESLSSQLAESDLKTVVTDALTQDSESIAAAGKTVGVEIATGLGGAGAEMEAAGADLITSATTGMSSNTEAVVTVVDTMMGQLTEQTTTGATEMDSAMATGMAAIQSTVEIGFNAVFQAIKLSLDQAVATSILTATNVVSALRGAVSGATQAGRDTGAGFNSGLEGQRANIMATAGSIASAAVASMKAALDSNSPSKKTMAVGEDTGDGYVIGMENKFRSIQQTARQMAQLGIPSLGATSHLHNVTNSRSVVNNTTYNDAPTASASQNTSANDTPTYTVVFDDGTFAGKLVPTISQIMGNNVADIKRGW